MSSMGRVTRIRLVLGTMLALQSGGLWAQTSNAPMRLAIISETADASIVSDLLAAELSRQPKLELLEREQIQKVYREQALSKANRDYLKLGQVLGADGLLVLSPAVEGTNHFLQARLVAVKPAVVLDSARSSWPVADVSAWAHWLASHYAPLLPKLGVPRRDALPISVVNLRSAVRSVEAQDLERQLTSLITERLTREQELFVLERRRMDLLSGEKELAGLGDSEFWNGSYLLEGVLDRDGYSKQQATIHARLVPPKGGAPVEIVVQGARSQYGDLVEQLTARLLEALRQPSSRVVWKPEAEAAKYFDEAKWALKWGMVKEAQAAAESAWALGKRDLDCASVRMKSYLAGRDTNTFSFEWHTNAVSELNANAYVERWYLADDKWAKYQSLNAFARRLPDTNAVASCLRTLEFYYEFSQSLPPESPRPDSEWYRLGLEALDAASLTLQRFYFLPQWQAGVKDDLSELRAVARAVAARISQFPPVRETYWIVDRTANADEFSITLGRLANIYRCKVDYGCFWQETPEDCVALYRDLLTSPVFVYLNDRFWFRGLERPLLCAWDRKDGARLPAVRDGFIGELKSSPDLVHRIEGLGLEMAWTKDVGQKAELFDAIVSTVLSNRLTIVTNNVDILGGNLDLGRLFLGVNGEVRWNGLEKLMHRYNTEVRPRLSALHQEYLDNARQRDEERKVFAAFRKQTELLKTTAPFDFVGFEGAFRFNQYTTNQAAELQPLLAAYKSNLVVQAQVTKGVEALIAGNGIRSVENVQQRVNDVLAPKLPTANQQAKPTGASPVPTNKPALVRQPAREETVLATNALVAKRFFPIPLERVGAQRVDRLAVVGERYRDGKLYIDVRYDGVTREQLGFGAAAAIWDAKLQSWEIVSYPGYDGSARNSNIGFVSGTQEGLYFEIFGGDYYFSDRREIKKFNPKTLKSETLRIPGDKFATFYTVHGRLLAANDETIMEILDKGQGTRVLASRRRFPPASTLDSLETLGMPVLFPGPGQTVRVSVGSKIYTWDGKDWQEATAAVLEARRFFTQAGVDPLRREELFIPNAREVFENATLVRSEGALWLLAHDAEAVERFWSDELRSDLAQPTWSPATGLPLSRGAVAMAGSNWFVYLDRSYATITNGGIAIHESQGRHGDLVFLDREFPGPLVIPLRFDPRRGTPPSNYAQTPEEAVTHCDPDSPWMLFTGNQLVIGQRRIQGIWVIPAEELNAAFAPERQKQRKTTTEVVAVTGQRQQQLLAKYDANHDGKIDAAEGEKAFNDPAYLESVWREIDTSGDGFLQASELKCFDLNKNRLLEAGEESILEKAQRVAAGRLFAKVDRNRDGVLDEKEIPNGKIAGETAERQAVDLRIDYDANHDGLITVDELVAYFKELTLKELEAPFVMAGRFDLFHKYRNNDPNAGIKAVIGAYWNELDALTKPDAQKSAAVSVTR
jgi:hypothetical protein